MGRYRITSFPKVKNTKGNIFTSFFCCVILETAGVRAA
ncbi:Uncharacterised protein [Lacrimispora sphenoides]|uniref:Uncharacterized protein n=1 Tax=Lacrimispora sphenoides JCM 1415 TaxID=1297793 RepID=A0ABY1C5K6_9FIRM|nr:hypothetical protein SAMN02745906_1244 [[Clostridium] sphenoides JCM 1415]SUY50613.1 Uncharacterised protein [Lacrimispora sphenoides]